VLSQGREVIGLGYFKLSSAAAMETDKGRRSDNLNRGTRFGDRDGRLGNPNQVIRVNSMEQQWPDYSGWVSQVSNTEQEPGSTSWVANMEQHSVNIENRVTQDSRGEGGKKSEEGKGVAPSQKPAPWRFPGGITKTQRRRLQKMCQKELV
jgi:hypothetical protein